MTKHVKYDEVTVERTAGSMLKITGMVPLATVQALQKRVLGGMVREYTLPGFRRGHVPEETVRAHVGEKVLLEETAERALSEAYQALVAERQLEVVGRPNITVTSIAPDQPIGFSIDVAMYPEVTLPAYAIIAEKETATHPDPETVEVTTDEVDAEVKRLQHIVTKNEGATQDAELPEPDDVFARTLGDFKDLADLKEKITKGLQLDKRQKAREKRRLAILTAILDGMTFEVPSVMVESELEQMVSTFKERLLRSGIDMQEYLQTIEKTIDDLQTEWRPDAEKRAKVQVLLNEIAKKEEIAPDMHSLSHEVAHLKEHHPDVETEVLYRYAYMQGTNELVLTFLERGAKKEVA